MNRAVYLFVSVVVVAAILIAGVVFATYGYPELSAEFSSLVGLLCLIILTVGAEVAAVRFYADRGILSISLIPLVAVVPLFGPSTAIAATALSEGIARTMLHERPVKSLFNAAQLTTAVALAALTYVGLGGPVSAQAFALDEAIIPFGGLVFVYWLTNTGLVSTVIALDTNRPLHDVWREFGTVPFVNDLASSFLALFVVFAFAEYGIPGLLVVVLPLFYVQHSYRVYVQLQKQNKEILELLVKTIEAKDPYTSGHSQRVAILSREIAQELGLKGQIIEEIETAALLHDIGKIDFAYSEFLQRPAGLSTRERELIRAHPMRGARLLASISSLSPRVLGAVRHHHERYDGNGYPDGLAGTDIPVSARIIMVADTVDAMLSNRPYRAACNVEDVAAELNRFSGQQFDPIVVQKFLAAGLIGKAARRAESARTPLPLADTPSTPRVSAR